MTPEQLKIGRKAAGLSVYRLAVLAGVATASIERFESGITTMRPRNQDRLLTALEEQGVQILAAGDIAKGAGAALHAVPGWR